jgi:NADPH:quinone reductase-like Zn-dependent oxidoreductase
MTLWQLVLESRLWAAGKTAQLASLMAAHKSNPSQQRLSTRKAAAAQQHLEAGRQFGKIVLQISA